MRQLLILAGGAGSRLAGRLGDLPKALADIDGEPLVHRHLALAAEHDFRRVVMLVRHGADLIRTACGRGEKWGLAIDYVEEAEPRGTAGAVIAALDQLADRFVVLYGDTVLNVDLERIWGWHAERRPEATLLVHPNDHPHDSDLVELDETDRVVAFHPYPHPVGGEFPNLVNGALYVVERAGLAGRPAAAGAYDFGKHLFPAMLASGADLRGYRSREYLKDAGTPERLERVIADVRSGKVAAGTLRRAAAAVLVDRDGTINEDTGYIASPEGFHLLPGSAEAIGRLNRSDYLSVVVTNQSVVARGGATEAMLRRIHNRMETLLGVAGSYVDAIYYCPHHPDRGYAGERPDLKIVCGCRKPETGLVERAKSELGLSIERSWFVGDSTVDLETARRAGMMSVLVKTGNAGSDGKFPQRPDFECADLGEAVTLILDVWPRLVVQAEEIAATISAGSCILIGGLARSGKSSLATALAYALRQRGLGAVVIGLDGWLRDVGERPPNGSVLDRFDRPAIEAVLARLAQPILSVDIPVYDRRQRGRAGSYCQTIRRDDVVIIDGVVALALDAVIPRPTSRIFVDRPEDARRRALWRDYEGRGYSPARIQEIYDGREADEHPGIRESRRTADTVVASVLR